MRLLDGVIKELASPSAEAVEGFSANSVISCSKPG